MELPVECLRHLERQTVQPARVLVVVDNASSDDSVSSANAFANVTVLRMKANLGFAAGNNRILAECATEFVALLNPDAFPEPDWLARLLTAAGSYPDVATFGSRQLCQGSPEFLDGIGDSYHMSGLVWRERDGARLRLAGHRHPRKPDRCEQFHQNHRTPPGHESGLPGRNRLPERLHRCCATGKISSAPLAKNGYGQYLQCLLKEGAQP